jgi:hypothetical protein
VNVVLQRYAFFRGQRPTHLLAPRARNAHQVICTKQKKPDDSAKDQVSFAQSSGLRKNSGANA